MASPRITVAENVNAAFRLANHQVSMRRLIALMNRVHSPLAPAEFIEAVSLAFKDAQGDHVGHLVSAGFRTEASFLLFQKAVRLAREIPGVRRSVMVLGCGRGFVGESSEFAARAVHEILSADGWRVDMSDVSPSTLSLETDALFTTLEFVGRQESYDLVVSHSLLHFIPDLDAFFSMLCRLLKPFGALVAGHEPNAKFWQSKECQGTVAELRKTRRVRGWRGHLRTNSLFQRFGGRDHTQRIFDKVNQRLMTHNGFTGPLTCNEISRLVDVHRPEAIPGDFRIGFDGFDVEELTRNYLPGFSLAWVGTSAHLGYMSSSTLSPEWLRREAILADEQPLAGSVLNAYWRKAPIT